MPLNEANRVLSSSGYHVFQCETKEEVVKYIFSDIFESSISEKTIGMAHSETLDELGLLEQFKQRAKNVYCHRPPETTKADDCNALLSDYYFLSANAVSEDGYLVNVDGSGNRVAASCYGPKHVIYVIGRNKIVKNLDDAIDRALNYATVSI